MEKLAPPKDWIGAKDKQWVPVESLENDDGILPNFHADNVNPLLARDLRENYQLVGQLGTPAIRVSKDEAGHLYLWKPDVSRWLRWQQDVQDGVIEIGRIW
jgi:hypothetical protein